MHYAVYNGNLNLIKDIFQFLSDKGTIINTKDSSGWAPLHYAVLYDASDMVKFLVDEGANINVKNDLDQTPLGEAKKLRNPEIANFLREKQNEKPVQRKRRHHHGDHDRHHLSRKPLAIDLNDQPEIATSSAVKPSSWINDLFGWTKEKGRELVSNAVNGDAAKELEDSRSEDIQMGSSDQQKLKQSGYDRAQEMEFQYMSKYDARKCNDKNIGAHSKKRGNGGQDRQQYESKISNKQNVISNSVNQSRIISNEKQQWSETFHGRPKPTLSHHSDKKHNFDGQPKKISERKEHTVNHKQFSSNSHKHDSQYKPMIDTNNKWSERISNEKIGNRRMIGNINQNQQNSHSSKHGHYQQGFHKYESYQQSSDTSRHPPLTRVTAQLDVPNTLSLLNLAARFVTKVKDQQPHSYKCSRMPKGSMRISKDVAERMELKVKVKKGDIIWYR